MYHDIRWTSEKVRQRLALIEPLVYRFRHPIPEFRLAAQKESQASNPAADDTGAVISWHSYWAGTDEDFVLHSRFQVPPSWIGQGPVSLYLPIGDAGDFSHPEALVSIDGESYAACDRHHQEIQLPPRWCQGDYHALLLSGWTGGTHNLRAQGQPPAGHLSPKSKLQMGRCWVVMIDQATRDLIALGRVALDVADSLDRNDPCRINLLNALDDAFKELDTREPLDQAFYDSVPGAHALLQSGVDQAGPSLDVDVIAVGHAHIDLAWLWPLAETRRKAGRTFHTMLRLMEQYPEFRFVQSQPQLTQWVRQDYPMLFEAIKERVEAGQWEVIGGMWVEADCNIPGGEALARQFLIGRNAFREHFGENTESPVLWLPDVFGYAWSLPQLIREAGLEYFFTIKIGWSQYNRMPYDSFWWQGLDGTRVLTHFSPTRESGSAFASTYNAKATPGQVLSTWTNFRQKDAGKPGATPPLLMAYGHGDGGGGPTGEMLGNIRQLNCFPAMPRTRCGTVREFFHDLETGAGDRLPTWNGELYLEYHRGTYTTQARNKRANRKSEFLLHDVEFLASYAALLADQQAASAAWQHDYEYPAEKIHQAWQLVCLNQFHDILPGSSIAQVYRDSLAQYARVAEIAESLKQVALAVIAADLGGDFLLVNPTSFARCDLAYLPDELPEGTMLRRLNGEQVALQPVESGWLLDAGELAPYSVEPLWLGKGRDQTERPMTMDRVTVAKDRLENGFLRVEFNANGEIESIFDKQLEREVLPAAAIANQFQLFEDRPRTPDAWEIDITYDDVMWTTGPAQSVRVIEAGPWRGMIEVRKKLMSSQAIQRISLASNSRRIDFDTTVHWRERHVMLKVAFPVDILSPVATYEIQWGNVQRPTHRNTSWDWARFETCAQKWVDLSEGDYGVSLLNDCKYGHDIRDNVMRLTLLRGPTDPDPQADLGDHRFTYSLFPHPGRWDENTMREAYSLNDPLIVWQNEVQGAGRKSQGPGAISLIAVDQANVVIETIKRAEDGKGIIVRLFESQRRRSRCRLTIGFPLREAWRTNLLEENRERLVTGENHCTFFIKPFQIVTLRLVPAWQAGQTA
ncbi:MAG: alpha-mannosidase [Chloroflexota bacterium]|nr:alpha-mannosidase [Chloroflexota bacterium]